MRGVLAVVGVAFGLGVFAWFDLARKTDNQKEQLEQTSRRLDGAMTENDRLRQALGLAPEAAPPVAQNRVLDALQKDVNALKRQINALQVELRRRGGAQPEASKVDARLDGLRAEIDALKKGLAEVRRPPPTVVLPPPPVVIELGFRSGPDTAVVLRYAGSSVADALLHKSSRKSSRILSDAVRLTPGDPKTGTVAFNYAVLRTPEVTRTLTLGGRDPLTLKMVRSSPSAADWDLSPDERKTVADFLTGP